MSETNPREYNGWTNYETWSVNLHITNDQDSQNYWEAAAQAAWKENRTATNQYWPVDEIQKWRRSAAIADLADVLRDEITEGSPLGEDDSLYGQLLAGALSDVSWREIAEHFIDSAIESPDPDDDDQDDDEEEEPDDGPELDDLADQSEGEPDDDDLVTYDHATFYQGGAIVLNVPDGEEYEPTIAAHMIETNYFPDVWFISDHGNAHLMTIAARHFNPTPADVRQAA